MRAWIRMEHPESLPNQRFFLRVAACLGAVGILLGAFGAHGLRGRLSHEMLAVFEVGVRYQLYHALAILAAALAAPTWWASVRLREACWAWLAGVVVFSGSLYLLALTCIGWFGAITPIGGVAFVAGWVFVAVGKSPS